MVTTLRRLVFVVTLGALSARSLGADRELLQSVAKDAAVVAHVDLEALQPLTSSLFRPFGIAAGVLFEQGAKAALGWSPFSLDGWRALGVTGTELIADVSELGPKGELRLRLLFRGRKQTLATTTRSLPALKLQALGGDRFALVLGNHRAPVVPQTLSPRVTELLLRPGVNVWMPSPRPGKAAARAECNVVEHLTKTGPIAAVLMNLHKDSRKLGLQVTFVPRDATLAKALTTTSYPLAYPKTARAGVASSIALAPLTSLQRPVGLTRLEEFRTVRKHCGTRVAAATMLFGWPLIAGLYIDELGKLGSDAKHILASLNSFRLAVKHTSSDPAAFVGAASVTIDESQRSAVVAVVENIFGAPTDEDDGRFVYGEGPMRAYTNGQLLVLALGRDALDWYLESGLAPGPRPDTLVHLFWNEARALTWLWQRAEAPWIDRFLQGFGKSGAELRWDGPELALTISLSEF